MFNSSVGNILKDNGRVSGVKLDDGSLISSNVVVNVAGPHSLKVNQMAGVEEEMNIKTKALKVEVSHVKPPENYDYETARKLFKQCLYYKQEYNDINVDIEGPYKTDQYRYWLFWELLITYISRWVLERF